MAEDWGLDTLPEQPRAATPLRPAGLRFRADLTLSELDDRGRPGPDWSARALELSRSSLVVRSRRLCYLKRTLAVAIHLIDDKPVPLMGTVKACDYLADGEYRVDLDLAKMAPDSPVYEWAQRMRTERRPA